MKSNPPRQRIWAIIGAASLLAVGVASLARPHGSMRHTASPELVITFAGLTNLGSGETQVQFEVTNVSGRGIQFGVGDVQKHLATGWPPESMLGRGTEDWVRLDAGSNGVFSVAAPTSKETKWRVPIIYQKDRLPTFAFLDRIEGISLGNLHWHWRHRDEVCRFIVGPEMVGLATSSEAATIQY